MEAQNNSSSSPPRSSGAARTKNDAQVTYGVRFRRSLHGWKGNFKELPMTLVSGPNSFRVDENHRNKRTFRICHGAATQSFRLLAHVSCWGPLWTWLGGYACPNHHIISSRRHIRVRVLFSLVFSFEKQTLCRCICGDKSLYIDPGPPFLISSTMSISHLESSS